MFLGKSFLVWVRRGPSPPVKGPHSPLHWALQRTGALLPRWWSRALLPRCGGSGGMAGVRGDPGLDTAGSLDGHQATAAESLPPVPEAGCSPDGGKVRVQRPAERPRPSVARPWQALSPGALCWDTALKSTRKGPQVTLKGLPRSNCHPSPPPGPPRASATAWPHAGTVGTGNCGQLRTRRAGPETPRAGALPALDLAP